MRYSLDNDFQFDKDETLQLSFYMCFSQFLANSQHARLWDWSTTPRQLQKITNLDFFLDNGPTHSS